MSLDFEKDLNKEQYDAVTSKEKRVRVIAGAGTGKTRVLAYRVAYLIDNLKYKPNEILCITFTNKVAKEMQNRILSILKTEDRKNSPFISTFHSFALRLLRIFAKELNSTYTNNFSVVDEDDQFKAFLLACEKSKMLQDLKVNKNDLKVFRTIISKLKSRGITPDEVQESDVEMNVEKKFEYKNVKELYFHYDNYLKSINSMDFDDLLVNVEYLVKNSKVVQDYCKKHIKCILVDEFQDTNEIQFSLIKLLTGKDVMLTVVGDPDQNIYNFRGADHRIITSRIIEAFPDMVTLPLVKNYRSTPEILQAANELISHNKERVPKNLVAHNPSIASSCTAFNLVDAENEGIFVSDEIKRFHDLNGVKYSDFAVIYRANYLSRVIEKRLIEKGIPYRIYGGVKFHERMEIKDALSYLKILINPQDSVSFERVMKSPSRGAGDVVFESAYKIAESKNICLLDAFRLDELKKTKNTTINLKIFFEQYDKTRKIVTNENFSVSDVVNTIQEYFEVTGFNKYVSELDEKEKNEQGTRRENIIELVNELEKYLSGEISLGNAGDDSKPTLALYLQNAAIQSAQDDLDSDDQGKVSLMTVHVSKGLEFPYVFVCGLVENIFPSIRNNNSMEDIEEERRLCFVAITRAIKKAYLITYRGYSKVNQGNNEPSRFYNETKVEEKNYKLDLDYSKYEGDTANNKNIKTYNDENWIKKYTNKDAKKSKVSQEFGAVNKSKTFDTYSQGDKVRHKKYGEGTVTSISTEKVWVDFGGEIGVRAFVLGFPSIEKIG